MEADFDLIVVGAGMAGVSAAKKCAAAGWKTAIVDKRPYGGTCALRGCDPKKILRRGAEVMDSARLMQGKGIDMAGMHIDWPALMQHKRGFTDPVPDRMEQGLRDANVETMHGVARFTGPQQMEVDGKLLRARHFLIAAGARPRPLSVPGAEYVIDSTAFLELDRLPDRILFIGGGFVSFEFAHIALRAGAKVEIADRGGRPLKGFDPDLVDLLVSRSEALGLELHRDSTLRSVQREGAGYRVELERDGEIQTVDTDLVVHGAGRIAELEEMNLGAADVDYGDKGITVAPHLQSLTNPAVFAAGDSADTRGMPLTPVAVFEGKVAASNLLKQSKTVPDYDGVPTGVFTVPELTRVGMLEQEAKDSGHDVDVRYNDTGSWFSNYRIGETTAATKVLVDKKTDMILGAHMLGPEYAEIINIVGLAIKLGLTAKQLRSMTALYPTVGSDLGSML